MIRNKHHLMNACKNAWHACGVLFGRLFPRYYSIQRYRRVYGRSPNLIKPKTFNEKILYRMLNDRNPRLTMFTDKYLSRKYVESVCGGDQYLPTIFSCIRHASEITKLVLPDQFVMKPNHLCGQIRIVRDVNKTNVVELQRLAKEWLQNNYYDCFNEWAYKNIKPLIMFEELLGADDEIPDDFKFNCFDGEVRFLEVHQGRFANHRCNIYDPFYHPLPVKYADIKPFGDHGVRPSNFNKMLAIARKLSTGIDFIRVDMYNIRGRIVIGEFCCYPAAGLGRIEPDTWDEIFGSYWTIRNR